MLFAGDQRFIIYHEAVNFVIGEPRRWLRNLDVHCLLEGSLKCAHSPPNHGKFGEYDEGEMCCHTVGGITTYF